MSYLDLRSVFSAKMKKKIIMKTRAYSYYKKRNIENAATVGLYEATATTMTSHVSST